MSVHGTQARAAAIEVSPTVNVVPSGRFAAAFELRNLAATPVTVQADAVRWSQKAGKDRFSPARRLIIAPPLFTIAPGGMQIVRIAPQSRRKGKENAYRVNFREVPPPPAPGFFGVRTALDLNVPLFFTPVKARQSLDLTAQPMAGGGLQLRASNVGTRFARMTRIVVRDSGGHVLGRLQGPQYVLPGASREWPLRSALPVRPGEKLTAEVFSGFGHRELPLPVE